MLSCLDPPLRERSIKRTSQMVWPGGLKRNPGHTPGAVGWWRPTATDASSWTARLSNFKVHYEIDDDTSKHVLTLDAYGGEGVGSWVLLEACE